MTDARNCDLLGLGIGGVMKRTAIAAATITFLLLSSSFASAQVCVVGIMAAAFYASLHDHRELTSKEAMTCGLLYGTDATAPKAKKIVHHTRHKPQS
jgi:hypothetical protein